MNTVLRFSFTIVPAVFLGASLLGTSATADGLNLPDTMVPYDHFAAISTRAAVSSRTTPRQVTRVTLNEPAPETSIATEAVASSKPAPAKKLSARPVSSPVSALNRKSLLAKNPYGEINDKRGLWPYKPGQKYERTNERGGGLFGGLFGG